LTAKFAKKGRKERKEILLNISLESAGSLIHRPNQRCHLPAIAIEFTFYLPPKLVGGKIIRMTGSFAAADVNFLPLQLAVFCVECELLSGNDTPRCLACGSKAILSLSRVLGGSLRGQPTAHLIADAELDRLVRSLLHGIPQVPMTSECDAESLASAISSRHHLRLRQPGPAALQDTGGVSGRRYEINPAEINLEPGISVIAEKAQALTGATGAAIALRRGSEIVCRARTGRTAPDIGCRLQTDRGLSAECVRTGEVLLCPDTEFNPRVDLATCRHLGVRSILVAPLRHFRRTIGVFEVLSSAPNAFDHHDVEIMQFLSGMMVAAISRLSSLQPGLGS
jgi:putative methionine-R-sulfoxide reductase with GAF domain